jgi:hypothetical protein
VQGRIEALVFTDKDVAVPSLNRVRTSRPRRPLRASSAHSISGNHDAACAEALLEGLQNGAMVVADKGHDADSIRTLRHQGGPQTSRTDPIAKPSTGWTKALYRERNRDERFFNKLSHIAASPYATISLAITSSPSSSSPLSEFGCD